MKTKSWMGAVAAVGLSMCTAGCGAALPEAPLSEAPVAQTHEAALEGFTESLHPRPLSPTSYWLHFTRSQKWMEVVYGSFRAGGPETPMVAEAGKPLQIRYSKTAGDLGDGGELRQVDLFYRYPGEAARSVLIARSENGPLTANVLRDSPVTLEIPVDAAGTLELWFQLTLADGRVLWDSVLGENHRVTLVPAGGTVLRFDDHWGHASNGPLRPGGALRLAYDVDRVFRFLKETHHHGGLTWGVTAFVSFDGNAARTYPVTANDFSGPWAEVRPIETAIVIPEQARSVSIWFQGWAYANAVWDSSFGANYTFAVSPQEH